MNMKHILFAFVVCEFASLHATAATLTLTWEDRSDNEDGFQMTAKCNNAPVFTDVGAPAGINVQTMQIIQASNQTCTYRLHAYNRSVDDLGYGPGRSLPSNEVEANTWIVPNAPGSLQKTASTAVRESSGAIVLLQQKAQGNASAARQAKTALANNQQTLNLVVKVESQIQK